MVQQAAGRLYAISAKVTGELGTEQFAAAAGQTDACARAFLGPDGSRTLVSPLDDHEWIRPFGLRCLTAEFNGAIFSVEWKEARGPNTSP
ncbi:hypothetical protein GGD56_000427 [Rhizobium mongolense]|uniref:Uncharacterized protein n=2 Tax=Rhizobium mongolense TaxID=57676 RepID=A0ABR6IFG7_9HYPH|nr:hypothetical protein [Rhizobium mongolense]TVZ73861.1 hypothetical protein BCL32_2134 [Rhizobium mongolense USDA 1844]